MLNISGNRKNIYKKTGIQDSVYEVELKRFVDYNIYLFTMVKIDLFALQFLNL